MRTEEQLHLDSSIVADINLVAKFLAAPSKSTPKADWIVVLGSALIENAMHGAKLFHESFAPRILISGGIGHSSPLLWVNLVDEGIEGENRPEADLFFELMVERYGIPESVITVENKSTNCGENAELSRVVFDDIGARPTSLIMVQDPTMQRRSQASFEKFLPGVQVYNSPPFVPVVSENGLEHEGWDFERFLGLLLGEIPRFELYGPSGRGFIGHVEVPVEVYSAWQRLSVAFPEVLR